MICPSSEDFVSYNRLRPLGHMICPSLEDFVLYNGLRLLGHMICPSMEDFVTYNGLCLLGNMICPSSEEIVTYNRLRPTGSQWSHDKVEHDKTNDTSRVAPKNDAKQVTKDQILWVVQESDRRNDNDLIYLNGLKFLGGRFSLWWRKRWWWIGFRWCSIEKQWAYRRVRISCETQDKANSLGWLFDRLFFLYVGISSY